MNITNTMNNNYIDELNDYMFTTRNLIRYTKHIIDNYHDDKKSYDKKSYDKKSYDKKSYDKSNKLNDKSNKLNDESNKLNDESNKINNENDKKKLKDKFYKPYQKDKLFWCFYILKYGFSNYEMEINNQHFVIEKQEKYKYVENMKKYKDILKIHKIKPLTEIEDDLINKDCIGIKTFFALCIIENINILLVDKRRVYSSILDETKEKNIVIKNKYEYYIDLEVDDVKIKNYIESYYIMNSFDDKFKSMSSYKLDDLLELAQKLNIDIGKEKITKKYIYELIVNSIL